MSVSVQEPPQTTKNINLKPIESLNPQCKAMSTKTPKVFTVSEAHRTQHQSISQNSSIMPVDSLPQQHPKTTDFLEYQLQTSHLQDQITSLQFELKESKAVNEQLAQQVTDLKSKVRLYKQRKHMVKKNNHSLREEIQLLRTDHSNTLDQLEALMQQHEQMDHKLMAQALQTQKAQQLCEQADHTVRQLREQLQQSEAL
jgi:chromosome segregation ATPase